MRTPRTVVVALLMGLVSGCGASASASATPESTIPPAPDIPAGWATVTSNAGDVRIAAPPDLGALEIGEGVFLQAAMDRGIVPIQVWAIGPRDGHPQPATGQSLRSWLEESGWLPSEGSGGVTALGDTSEREVWLPAGRALEVSTTVQPGTPEVSRVVGYAIETPAGFAVLQLVGQPDFFEDRGADLAMLTQLVSFPREP